VFLKGVAQITKRRRDDMNIKSASPVIYPIIVPTSSTLLSFNFYLVKNQDKLFLVDAGLDSEKCWLYFNQVVKENGFKFDDINGIILTHSHQDHTGIVNRILSSHDIPVYAHQKSFVRLTRNQIFLNKRIEFFRSLYSEMGCKEKGETQVKLLQRKAKQNQLQAIKANILPLKEDDMVNGFKVIETPGHWPDHIALLHPESGILLGGDHLIQHISSNALIEPDELGRTITPLQQYERSLKKCQNYSLTVVYPGHGEIVEDPEKLIKKRLNGIEEKSVKIRNIIQKKQLCTAAQVAQTYYEQKYDSEFSLVMSEIIGHLYRLEELNKISKRQKNNEWYYYSCVRE
jgi:glyoxylase-like metal-dependent hydrolase (beta-lactamase superfamily II)